MIRSIVSSSMKLRFLALALAVALIVFGVVQLRAMPVDVLPEFNPPSVEIQTEALGLAADEVEQLITVPMEQDLLNGVPWLTAIRSESVPGMSSIVLIFQPGTDLMRARQMVAERMTQAVALPHVSKPPTMLQPLSSSSRVLLVGLSSKNLSLIQMSVLARWTIAPRLMGIPGVANVAIWGQRDRQLQVLVDPKRLQERKVQLTSVLETVANALWVSSLSFVEASTPGTGGFIDTANQRLGIRHILPIVSPDGLAQVPLQDSPGNVGDVATVVQDHQPLIGDALINDGPSVLMVVEKFPNANTLEVTQAVEKALDDMRPGLSGMTTDSSLFRPADFILAAIDNVGLALLIGAALLLLVLAGLFFNWRALLISAVSLAVSLIAAVLVLYLRGATLNAVALGGLLMALGLVVDDIVIDLDNTLRRLREFQPSASPTSVASAILEATLEVRSPAGFAFLISVLVVLPIFFIEGMTGNFLQPLAVSYVVAVIVSMLVALFVTPALSFALLSRMPAESRQPWLARQLQRAYAAVLAPALRRPSSAAITLAVVVALGLAAVPFLRVSLLPTFKQRDLVVQLKAPAGTSQPEMSRIAGRVSQELRSVPGVRAVTAQVGRAVQGDRVVNVSSADIWVSMDPDADYDATGAAIQKIVSGYPGIHRNVQTYLDQQSQAATAGPGQSLVVRVYGDAADVLRAQAEQVSTAIAGIQGIAATHVILPVEQPALDIEVNMAAAQRYGIKPGDVRRAAATLLSGTQVGNLFEEQKVFDVVVWSAPAVRHSISSVEDLIIDTPLGGHVRLGNVAQVRIAPHQSIIRHDSVKRYMDVVVDVRGRNATAVAAEIAGRIKQMQFPIEYHAEVLGDYAAQQAAQSRVLVLAIAAAVAIFFLLQAAFNSWRLAFMSFLTLPSALTGGLLAALVGGGVLSLGSLAGLLAVVALAARQGVALIKHYQHLERHGGAAFGAELVVLGSGERSLPVLMAALGTALAFLPALFLGDVPGLEFMRPMAVVILGGLVTSTLLNLYIVPVLYLKLGAGTEPELELAPAPGVAAA